MKKITLLNYHNHPGFTLLEMLFAVIIFSFSLVSLMAIASKGVVATNTARDQLTAQYLAEETSEVARNMRDTNFLAYDSGTTWLEGLANCKESRPCDVEYSSGNTPVLVACDDDCSGRLLYESGGVYSTDASIGGGGAPTTFWRRLYIDQTDLPESQARVTAEVHWKQKNFYRLFTMVTYLADWQNQTQ